MQDPTYPIQLATELRYSDPQKLAEILNDCTDILLAKRAGVKDYENKRKRRIDNAVLNDLPKYATKIKKLFQHNRFDFWLKSPTFKLHFVEFHFDIDHLDLLSLLTLNSIDEAIAQAGDHSAKDTDVMHCFNRALEYWETLQVRKKDWVKSGKSGEVILERYRIAAKHRQTMAGITSAAKNKLDAVWDDLLITEILLLLLSDETNKSYSWRSLNEFANDFLNPINRGLSRLPLLAKQSEMGNISAIRLKSVIKEINHFDKELLRAFVKKPIPAIADEDSRWRYCKITKKWNADLNVTYLSFED